MKPKSSKRRLRLESLEVRALLAGDLGSDFAHAMAAVQASAAIDASFSIPNGNHLLELTGHDTEALVIDLDRLPGFITKLSISHFASVTMSGTDSVDYLIAADIGSVFAPNLSITNGLHLHNVGSVDLASGGQLALLTGTATEFSVRSLEHTTIYSDLQSLTIDSTAKILNIESWNADQTVQLRYHPDSVTVSGIASQSLVRFFDTPREVAPSPQSPSGSDSGAGTLPPFVPGDAVQSPETPVILIVNSLDERSRAFISELRESLRTSSKDSQRLVLEFLNHAAPDATVPGSASPEVSHATYRANLRDLEGRQVANETQAVLENQGASETPAVAVAPAVTTEQFVDDHPLQFPPSSVSLTTEPVHRVEIDATWPVAVTPEHVSENPRPFVPLGSSTADLTEPKLEDSLRAFTDYVVDRVAAEFSPGEQSLVLLVDPKPTRSAAVNQSSALDQFSSNTLTSIARLQQAMS